MRPTHLIGVELRHTDPSDFPFLLQLHHRAPAFFQILRWPVDLVEVDYIDIQPAQTVLAFAADRSRR